MDQKDAIKEIAAEYLEENRSLIEKIILSMEILKGN